MREPDLGKTGVAAQVCHEVIPRSARRRLGRTAIAARLVPSRRMNSCHGLLARGTCAAGAATTYVLTAGCTTIVSLTGQRIRHLFEIGDVHTREHGCADSPSKVRGRKHCDLSSRSMHENAKGVTWLRNPNQSHE